MDGWMDGVCFLAVSSALPTPFKVRTTDSRTDILSVLFEPLRHQQALGQSGVVYPIREGSQLSCTDRQRHLLDSIHRAHYRPSTDKPPMLTQGDPLTTGNSYRMMHPCPLRGPSFALHHLSRSLAPLVVAYAWYTCARGEGLRRSKEVRGTDWKNVHSDIMLYLQGRNYGVLPDCSS